MVTAFMADTDTYFAFHSLCLAIAFPDNHLYIDAAIWTFGEK